MLACLAIAGLAAILKGGYDHRLLMKEADAYQLRIKGYRSEFGRLPDDAHEMGLQEDLAGLIFYKKVSESDYVLWYGTTLGESVTYSSKTGKWE